MSKVGLPLGWKFTLLENVAVIQTGLAKGKTGIKDPVQMPYLRVANVKDEQLDLSKIKEIEVERSEINRYSLQKGDVLLTEGGDNDKLGRGTVWNGEIENCLHQNHIFVVRTNPDVLDNYFFSYLRSSPYGKLYFRKCAKQSTNLASINTKQIKAFPVLLPPLQEQRKITGILSTWDDAIALTEGLIAALQTRKKGLMQKMLTGEVRFPHIINSKEKKPTGNGEIPEDWIFTGILELGGNKKDTVQTGPFGAQLHASDYVAEGVPMILIRNIENNRLNPEGIPKISKEDAERLKRYALQENDIVFSRVGRVGSCFLATKEHVGWIISGQTLRIRLPKGIVNFEYLSYALQGDDAQRYITGVSIGTTRQSISTEILESLPVILPPIQEQEKIVEVLKDADSEIDLNKQKLNALILQKKGLMQRLLTGEVRVTI